MAQETYRIEIPIVATDKTSPGVDTAQEHLNGFDKSVEETNSHMSDFGQVAQAGTANVIALAAQLAALTAVVKEMYEWLGSCVNASLEFESALTGVAKTTDFTDEELASMSDSIKQLSEQIPATTTELAGVAEAAGQLGIAKDNLLDFTKVMTELGTATNMTSDEAATMLAQFANITGMSPSNYENLGSAIVDLGNHYATTEAQITDMAQGMAAQATIAGMNESDILGLSAAVSSLGIDTAAGATSMNTLISTVMTAVETGKNLNEFASVAGMSAQEFKQAWGQDAVSALSSFISGLNDTTRNGASATVLLNDLGLSEARLQRMTLSLANSGDLLNNAVGTANNAWNENTALTDEANKRYATTESQLALMKNAYNNAKVAVGDAFTPALKKLYGVGANVLSQIADFIEANPGLVQAVTAFVGIMSSAVLILSAYATIAKVAALANQILTASIPGLNVIMAVVGGLAVLTSYIIAVNAGVEKSKSDYDQLDATSKDAYNQLQELNAEYADACKTYGDTSYQAAELKQKIDDLTESYEKNKQTTQDLQDADDKLETAMKDSADQYQDSIDSINDEYDSTTNLINRMEDLQSKTSLTAAEQQEMASIVDILNDKYKNLGLTYNRATGASNMTAASIAAMAKAEAETQTYNADQARVVDLYKEQASLQQDISTYTDEANAAQNVYNDALDDYNAAKAEADKYTSSDKERATATASEADAMAQAKGELDGYNADLQEKKDQLAANQDEIDSLTQSMADYADAQNDATASADNIDDAIVSTESEIKDLTDAYQEAYTAAQQSVESQYELWDKAAESEKTSMSSMMSDMQSQIDYWNNYSDTLDNLNGRDLGNLTGSLQTMVKSMADGSEDSASYLQGLNSLDDSDLSAIVQQWQDLQTAQQDATNEMAQTQTNFPETMQEIMNAFEENMTKLDMSDDAKTDAMNTVQAYTDGLSSGATDAGTAAASVAGSAVDAYVSTVNGGYTSAYNAGASLANAVIAGAESVGGGGYVSVSVNYAAHAEGGIFASPHMGLVAEDGPEAIIPLSSGRRDRGIELWEQAGDQLGVSAYADGGTVGAASAYAGDSYPVMASAGKAAGGGVRVSVNVSASPEIKIDAGGEENAENIVAAIRANIRSLGDDIGGEIAEELMKIFGNMPVAEGA